MLSEKLPGFDSPRLQRRLSRYLGSQTSLGSLSEEVTMKQVSINIDNSNEILFNIFFLDLFRLTF